MYQPKEWTTSVWPFLVIDWVSSPTPGRAPLPLVPLRTVESPMSHNVGKAALAGMGGEYLPLLGAPAGAGIAPIWVSRGTSLVCSDGKEEVSAEKAGTDANRLRIAVKTNLRKPAISVSLAPLAGRGPGRGGVILNGA